MRIAWVIPCFQEEDALPALAACLPSIEADEVVLVDDGSTDGTAAALAALARRDARVRIETHATNRGVGAAMRTGFRATRADVVVAYDADMTYPLEDGGRLVAAVAGGADVAVASPFCAGGTVSAGPVRRFLSRAASRAYRLVLGPRARGVRGFTAGFRAYRGNVVRDLRFRSDGFPATAEILGRLCLAGARVVEVPSALSARVAGRSKMRVARAVLGHGAVLLRLLGCRLARLFRRGVATAPVTAP
jgi:dolichol-phosphate mannosyltransferase